MSALIARLKAWVRSKVRDPEMPLVEPPVWIERIPSEFVRMHVTATVGEWHRFAVLHSVNAYHDGFRAGWEAKEFGPLPDASGDYDPREPVSVLADEELDRPVLVQAPPGYEHVTFVDERGVRRE